MNKVWYDMWDEIDISRAQSQFSNKATQSNRIKSTSSFVAYVNVAKYNIFVLSHEQQFSKNFTFSLKL